MRYALTRRLVASLIRVNALDARFGLPIAVGTNGWNATTLGLKTRVGLAGGYVHIGFENVTVPFEVWISGHSTMGEWRFIHMANPEYLASVWK